jgi:hypothetical protein
MYPFPLAEKKKPTDNQNKIAAGDFLSQNPKERSREADDPGNRKE